MDYHKVEIQLAGDPLNVLVKAPVSVPEILVLREIHGKASVKPIGEKLGSLKVSPRRERDRLNEAYPGRDGDGVAYTTRVFGGDFLSALPQTLADIQEPERHDDGTEVEDESDSFDKALAFLDAAALKLPVPEPEPDDEEEEFSEPHVAPDPENMPALELSLTAGTGKGKR